MKRYGYYLFWAILSLLVPGCVPAEQEPSAAIPVKLSVASGVPVKSSYSMGDNELGNLTVALYENGRLSREYYFDSMEGIQLSNLPMSRYYSVYALANMAHVSFPAHETDIEALRVSWDRVGSAGWPMASSRTATSRSRSSATTRRRRPARESSTCCGRPRGRTSSRRSSRTS